MLGELRDDNGQMTAAMHAAHGVCDENGDVASASLIEVWIDETEPAPGSCSRLVDESKNRATDRLA